jgi:hypothetical protein
MTATLRFVFVREELSQTFQLRCPEQPVVLEPSLGLVQTR